MFHSQDPFQRGQRGSISEVSTDILQGEDSHFSKSILKVPIDYLKESNSKTYSRSHSASPVRQPGLFFLGPIRHRQ